LLLGPTGSGKTPLGRALEKNGYEGRRCVHFDFGANLREVAALKRPPRGFTEADMAVIRDSLRTGALLENKNFPIVEKIMGRFRRKRRMGHDDLLVLNGLPRHKGQAVDLEATVRVTAVILLDASLELVQGRIRRDAGGDRRGRMDDSAAEIARKYAVYMERTKPLLDYYARRGVPIRRIRVDEESTAETEIKSISGGGSTACPD